MDRPRARGLTRKAAASQQPELRVVIFNTYGQKVFQAQPYTNSWDGGGLPEGVYYYQLQNQQGKAVKKGAITLVR